MQVRVGLIVIDVVPVGPVENRVVALQNSLFGAPDLKVEEQIEILKAASKVGKIMEAKGFRVRY